MSKNRIDVSKAMAGLKDFQRRTIDYVFKRMYLDESPARAFSLPMRLAWARRWLLVESLPRS